MVEVEEVQKKELVNPIGTDNLQDSVQFRDLASVLNDAHYGTPVHWIFISDFGDKYAGATISAAQTLIGAQNIQNSTDLYLDALVLEPYKSFDIISAANRIKGDLELTIASLEAQGIPNYAPIGVSFVVDSEKKRKNVLSEWKYKGRTIYIAHPDHGQISMLLNSPGTDWEFVGATRIDKKRIIPDYEIAHEHKQLWDGHAAYAPAAITALINGGASSVGLPLNKLRHYSTEILDEGSLEKIAQLSEMQVLHNSNSVPLPGNHSSGDNLVLHYFGDDLATIIKMFSEVSSPSNSIIQTASYGQVNNWFSGAERLRFAGINIFQDAPINHLLFYYSSQAEEYVIAKLGSDKAAQIYVIAPNDECASLLFDKLPPTEYSIIAKSSLQKELQDIVNAPSKYAFDNSGQIKRNGKFRTITIDEANNEYEVIVLDSDANGNIVLNLNPYELPAVDFDRIKSLSVTFAGLEGTTNTIMGDFDIRENYSFPEYAASEASGARGANSASDVNSARMSELHGRPVGAILNPARAGILDGQVVLSRRPVLELFSPSYSLVKLIKESDANVPSPGDRMRVQLKYQ